MSATGAVVGASSVDLVQPRAGSPSTWTDLVARWESYVEEKEGQRLVFIGSGAENDGELMTAPYSHRFQQGYTRMQYAKIQGFIRGALDEYDDPYLVFLTFSTSTLAPTGEPRPPLDHMDELLDTWGDGVYYELNRVMAGDRKRDPWTPREDWEYLYILEPTTDAGYVGGGYAHAHAAIVVDGEVDPARFESVVTRHLVEAPNARGEAHEFDDTIEVRRAADLGNPGAYLFKYLGKSWDVDEMTDYERRFAALLFDQGRQRFRASNGAQRWMKRDEDESEAGEWTFAGVATERQARELREYDGLEDFLIATNELGVRSWLQKHRKEGVREGEEGPRPLKMSHEEFFAGGYERGRPVPMVGGSAPEGDRPPP